MSSRRRWRSLAVCLGSLGLAGLVVAMNPGLGLADPAPTPAPKAASNVGSSLDARAAAPAFTQTKTLTRVFTNADGTTYTFPSHTVTVDASQTHDLRGRQRILISWSGAQPSGGRASNPFGETGTQQEYPVMILECRGTDSSSVAPSKRVSPSTCFTTSVAERSQVIKSDSEAAWTHDLYGAATDTGRTSVSGSGAFPSTALCPTADSPPYFTHLTPFVGADGRSYAACDPKQMPPEAAVGAAYPANEIAAFTNTDGTGSVQFELRSDVENESLGCSNKVACSIEVIPINGLSCDKPSSPPSISDQACRKGGQFPPGSSNFANQGVDQAVSPVLWWSGSNWNNRFSIPLTFGLPPDTCDVLDPRPPTGFYGSELLAQASLQWAPAYCLSAKRFKYQDNQMSDDAGWNLMESGQGPAALVSSAHEKTSDDPVAYAPTAVTGFGIGYTIDYPDNGGEVSNLKLNARLVAKLLTESYVGSALGAGHPGMAGNPVGIMNDPEFQQLNPGLTTTPQEAGAALLSLSNDSDSIYQLTDWIAHDKSAMAFVHGTPDTWGMVVNPSFKDLALPTQQIPLLDTYVPESNNDCLKKNPAVYFNELAAPVSTLRTVAQALLDGWPNVQTRCDYDQSTGLYKLGRVDRQSYGARFMLGVVSLGDAARFGLHTASLETTPGNYVGADDRSLAAAFKLSKRTTHLGPFVLDQAKVRRSTTAYPGTMVVYTAAKTHNLDADDAAKVAQFIHISTTEGQRPGTGNGQLPEGFVPIEKTGATKPLFDSAQLAATAIAAQKAPPSASTSPTVSTSPTTSTSPTSTPSTDAPTSSAPDTDQPGTDPGSTDVPPLVDSTPPLDAPSEGAVPTTSPSPSVSSSAAPTTPSAPTVVQTEPTRGVDSSIGARFLPSVLLLGLLGLAISSGLRFFVAPKRRP